MARNSCVSKGSCVSLRNFIAAEPNGESEIRGCPAILARCTTDQAEDEVGTTDAQRKKPEIALRFRLLVAEELQMDRLPLASGIHYSLGRDTYGVFTLKRDIACYYAPTYSRDANAATFIF